MRKPTMGVRALLPLLAVLAACEDRPTPAEPGPAADRAGAGQASGGGPRSGEELYAAIGRDLPGFGGLFFDAAGDLNVYLTDPSREASARSVVAAALGPKGMGRGSFRVQRGRWEFAQLAAWRGRMSAVMSVPGVVLSDVDETRNRIRIGVEDAAAGERVRAMLARLDVPAEAVAVEVTEPYRFAATLRDRVRNTVGGLQIAYGNSLCTLGFHVSRDFSPGFVTNSHCTAVRGVVDGTQYFQPNVAAADFIGTEVMDPAFATGGQVIGGIECPPGRRCRFSDAALVRSEGDQAVGYVARTTSRGRYTGSLTISTSNPRFSFTSQSGVAFPGTQVEKVGRTTGWTYGPVTSFCADVNVGVTDITLLCQTIVDAGSGPGDSGSPVFAWDGGTYGLATLHGILWGGNDSGTSFVFSTIGNVERELGCLHAFTGDGYFSDCSG